MKNLLMIALLMTGFTAFAQQDGPVDMDQLQQQAPRETQREVERAANNSSKNKEVNDIDKTETAVIKPVDSSAVRKTRPKK